MESCGEEGRGETRRGEKPLMHETSEEYHRPIMSSRNALSLELAGLPEALRARLAAHGFDERRFLALADRLDPSFADQNRLKGPVEAPADDELLRIPDTGAEEARLRARGEEALSRGEVAMVVLAGGMATRMGGVVKALVPAVLGRTFLELRLRENETVGRRYGKPVPLWLMASDATHEPTTAALKRYGAGAHVATFVQDLSLRLTPEGALFRDDAGAPSTYATGHGDLPDALRRSGLLGRHRAAGGTVVWIANLDNLGATVDPVILGLFLEQRDRGKKVMVEVCDKAPLDKGGGPVHAEGTLQVVEEFRLPVGFDASRIKVFNTNTVLVDAAALDETAIDWTWFRVEKAAHGRKAIQFERLVQELTRALPAAYVRVPRDGVTSRFLPVKDPEELARRGPELSAVATSRGML